MPGPADLGFAEFVSTLLSETAAAVVSAHAQQEERLRALAETATLTPEEYAPLVPPAEVDAALVGLLPDGDGGTAAVAGGAVPDKEVLLALGLELTDAHVDNSRLTEAGALAIRQVVAEHLAGRHVEALRAASRIGVPRVVVDGGKVSAKLTYSIVESGEGGPSDPGPPPAGRPVGLDPRLVRLARVRPDLLARIPAATAGVRLQVRPASADTVQDTTVRADVFGEVSVTFRTVL